MLDNMKLSIRIRFNPHRPEQYAIFVPDKPGDKMAWRLNIPIESDEDNFLWADGNEVHDWIERVTIVDVPRRLPRSGDLYKYNHHINDDWEDQVKECFILRTTEGWIEPKTGNKMPAFADYSNAKFVRNIYED